MSNYIDAAKTIGEAIAVVAPTHRQCTIQIKNESDFKLYNSRTYTESGSCTSPLTPFIAPSGCGEAQFSKTPHTACGSVGVFTYELHNQDKDQHTEIMAVMFSVPYDFNMYSNWYAVGIFEKSKECDRNLYTEMYHNTQTSFVRGEAKGQSLNYKGDHVQIMATMSDCHHPIIKVHVMNPSD